MKSKLLNILGIFVLLLTSNGPVFAAASGFPDTNGTVYSDAFAYLQKQGAVQGYSDGLAHPNEPLNRIEALKVTLEILEKYDSDIARLKKNTPSIGLFSDTSQKEWYAAYLEVGFDKHIVTGYPDNTFRPAQRLRTEEAITMLMRAFGESTTDTKAELSPYIQNKPNAWFTGSINTAIARNLIMKKGEMKLGYAITRGQFFDIAYRLHSMKSQKQLAFRGSEPSSISNLSSPISQPTPPSNGSTGIVKTTGVAPVIAKIDHPYASEKYFAVSMPSIGIHDLTISHPEDALSADGVLEPLDLGVGHLFSYPGGGGKIMVYGHSSGYPWDVSEYTKIFRKINELNAGDKIYVTYAGKLYVYEVTHEQTVAASDTSPFNDNGSGEEILFYTCWPIYSTAQRYIVHAVPVETVALR